jgi:hypothetical protein
MGFITIIDDYRRVDKRRHDEIDAADSSVTSTITC